MDKSKFSKQKVAAELLKVARDLMEAEQAPLKLKSAVKSLVSGVGVGVSQRGNRVVIFSLDDYDGRGTLIGPFVDISRIDGSNGFYLAAYNYDSDALANIGSTPGLQDRVMKALNNFKREHR